MPCMDGPTATREIRALGVSIPIFGVTGNGVQVRPLGPPAPLSLALSLSLTCHGHRPHHGQRLLCAE
jgi:CheY-like chemotaxis protein